MDPSITKDEGPPKVLVPAAPGPTVNGLPNTRNSNCRQMDPSTTKDKGPPKGQAPAALVPTVNALANGSSDCRMKDPPKTEEEGAPKVQTAPAPAPQGPSALPPQTVDPAISGAGGLPQTGGDVLIKADGQKSRALGSEARAGGVSNTDVEKTTAQPVAKTRAPNHSKNASSDGSTRPNGRKAPAPVIKKPASDKPKKKAGKPKKPASDKPKKHASDEPKTTVCDGPKVVLVKPTADGSKPPALIGSRKHTLVMPMQTKPNGAESTALDGPMKPKLDGSQGPAPNKFRNPALRVPKVIAGGSMKSGLCSSKNQVNVSKKCAIGPAINLGTVKTPTTAVLQNVSDSKKKTDLQVPGISSAEKPSKRMKGSEKNKPSSRNPRQRRNSKMAALMSCPRKATVRKPTRTKREATRRKPLIVLQDLPTPQSAPDIGTGSPNMDSPGLWTARSPKIPVPKTSAVVWNRSVELVTTAVNRAAAYRDSVLDKSDKNCDSAMAKPTDTTKVEETSEELEQTSTRSEVLEGRNNNLSTTESIIVINNWPSAAPTVNPVHTLFAQEDGTLTWTFEYIPYQ